MTYARARLWLGISGVGMLVLAAAFALWFDLPDRLLHGRSDVYVLAVALAAYIAISIPSDLLGGYLLPRRHGRSPLRFSSFLGSWLRGVLVQAAVQLLCALTILSAAKQAGPLAGVGIFCVLELTLLLAQRPLAGLLARLTPTGADLSPLAEALAGEPARVRHLDELRATDSGFVGGVTGLPGAERIVLPALWRATLPPAIYSAELLRRTAIIASGARTRGLAVAFGFNIFGFILASHCPDASLTDAQGIVTTALWFTLWSFAGLLTLPSLNRPGVFEADRLAQDALPAGVVATTIRALDRLQDDEPARSTWIERIFHPIPSVESRLAALSANQPRTGAWQCARTALYLSWAGLSLLPRAVHCNAGRPELWVLYPGD